MLGFGDKVIVEFKIDYRGSRMELGVVSKASSGRQQLEIITASSRKVTVYRNKDGSYRNQVGCQTHVRVSEYRGGL